MPENELGKNNGGLPYLLLLACPLIQIFMHGSHGHGGEGHEQGRRSVFKGGGTV